MDSIKKAFQPLLNRLYILTKESEYIPDFDFVRLIKELESTVVPDNSDVALKEINRCLLLIDKISEGNPDFFKRFRGLEYEKVVCKDEDGNEGYEERHTWVPLPESERERINNDILVELRFYTSVLEQMRNFSNYDTGLQSLLPKEKKPKSGKRPPKLSFGFKYKGKENLLSDVNQEQRQHP